MITSKKGKTLNNNFQICSNKSFMQQIISSEMI